MNFPYILFTGRHDQGSSALPATVRLPGEQFTIHKTDVYSTYSQGCYSEEGDIVVLCAYLGQLARVRDTLANEVAVVIDDRDQLALADQEAETEEASEPSSGVERVRVVQRVELYC